MEDICTCFSQSTQLTAVLLLKPLQWNFFLINLNCNLKILNRILTLLQVINIWLPCTNMEITNNRKSRINENHQDYKSILQDYKSILAPTWKSRINGSPMQISIHDKWVLFLGCSLIIFQHAFLKNNHDISFSRKNNHDSEIIIMKLVFSSFLLRLSICTSTQCRVIWISIAVCIF